jgi:hypothetical protein
LQRPKEGAVVIALGRWFENDAVKESFWNKPKSEYRKAVQKAFQAYDTWWRARNVPATVHVHHGMLPGDFSATFEKDGLRLGIVGLNATFLQLTGGDYTDKLALDVRQIHHACNGDAPDWVAGHHACILMTHQPSSWLHPSSEARFEAEINPHGRFLAHIHGHMHEPEDMRIRAGGAAMRRRLQGAALFGLESWDKNGKDDDRIHGYSAGRLTQTDVDRAELRIWPRILKRNKLAGHDRMVPDLDRFDLDDEQCITEIVSLRTPRAGGI